LILSKKLYIKRSIFASIWLFLRHFMRSSLSLLASLGSTSSSQSERKRGLPYLTLKADQSFQCNACGLCIGHCPSRALDLTTSESGDFIDLNLDVLKCTLCGLCQEACPIDAIRMGDQQASAMHVESDWVLDAKALSTKGLLSRLAK